VNKTSSTEN